MRYRVVFQSLSLVPLPTVDCGHPKSPQNGSLGSPTGTTERSLVVYRCDQNLVPERSMTSVCTVNGWNPNPAELVCNVGMSQ